MVQAFRYRSLVDLAMRRGEESGQAHAYTYLNDGELQSETLNYKELHQRARRVAMALRELEVGDRAILVYPPGLHFISAFLGCLYAGVIAVPAYPPHLARLEKSLPRLRAIATSSGASAVLTTHAMLDLVSSRAGHSPELAKLKWIGTDILLEGSEDEWSPNDIGLGDIAFLQYTSGSTGSPKGVIVTHGNLLANLHCTYEACFRGANDNVYVGWLPPYHDMGLIGQLLQPLYSGYPCVTMSPLHFLQRPLRWLQAITRYHGTTSASPNFAFDLCSRKITAEERAGLDLSTWSVVFNGAEPISAATLHTFSELFGPCGFRPSSFFPCYGLAEATLMVSGGARHEGYRTYDVDADLLEEGHAAPPGEGRRARTLVSVGRPVSGHDVTIVDDGGAIVAPCVIGEILVSGPSVAQGYWGDREQSETVFGGPIDSRRLRSGDLGFMREDGELFVTGRRKDLVIIRGRNLVPQDLERAVEDAHPAVRRGCVAAFSIDTDQGEQLVIMAEVERRYRERRVSERPPGEHDERRALPRRQLSADPPGDPDVSVPYDPAAIVAAIHQAIADEFAIRAAEVLLLRAASIPKTSSGKLRRFQCRSGRRDNTLPIVFKG